MLRKKVLLLFSAITLVSGLTFGTSQAAEFCTRPSHCRNQQTNCLWGCASMSGMAAVKCRSACNEAYDRCCSN